MALTRKFLAGMGLTEEQVDAIVEEHSTTVNALKKQRDDYEEDAERLKDVEKELKDLKKKVAEDSEGADEWKAKYEKEHKDFEAYKQAEQDKATKQAVQDAYKALLKENGVDDKYIPLIMRGTNFDEMKLEKDGKLTGQDKLSESIKAEFGGFIPTTGSEGADVSNPPKGSTGKYASKEEIMKIKDTSKRQEAIMNNPDLFN